MRILNMKYMNNCVCREYFILFMVSLWAEMKSDCEVRFEPLTFSSKSIDLFSAKQVHFSQIILLIDFSKLCKVVYAVDTP